MKKSCKFNSLQSGSLSLSLYEQISVSSDPDAIFNIVPRDYLPLEYGGTHGIMEDISRQMEAKLASYDAYFQASQYYGTDEKLRDFTNPTADKRSSFGAVGSFRKLEID